MKLACINLGLFEVSSKILKLLLKVLLLLKGNSQPIKRKIKLWQTEIHFSESFSNARNDSSVMQTGQGAQLILWRSLGRRRGSSIYENVSYNLGSVLLERAG